jgi:hypothetical protein
MTILAHDDAYSLIVLSVRAAVSKERSNGIRETD